MEKERTFPKASAVKAAVNEYSLCTESPRFNLSPENEKVFHCRWVFACRICFPWCNLTLYHVNKPLQSPCSAKPVPQLGYDCSQIHPRNDVTNWTQGKYAKCLLLWRGSANYWLLKADELRLCDTSSNQLLWFWGNSRQSEIYSQKWWKDFRLNQCQKELLLWYMALVDNPKRWRLNSALT